MSAPSRVGPVAMLLLCGLLVGCSASGDDGPQDETTGASDRPSAEAPTGGESKTVSVATITLPDPGPWTEKITQESDSTDEVYYLTGLDENQVPSCRASLSVQGGYTDGMPAARVMLEALAPVSIGDDSDAPEGVEGVIARFAGPKEAGSTQRPFTSTVRHWLTPGNTLITVSETITDDDTLCEKDEVIASLKWSGKDRPAPTATE